jgi:hypothetical protein
MPIASGYPFLDIMWTMFVFFAFLPLIAVLIYTIARPAEQSALTA